MPRSVTLFTGQWADLPLEQLCSKAQQFGYDGLELACWGDHFDINRAAESDSYCEEKWKLLQRHNLFTLAISAHLVGQAICDRIDERHRAILPPEIWGEGNSEQIKQRASDWMKRAAVAARRFRDVGERFLGRKFDFAPVVNGFTGSSIWHAAYAFPPTTQEFWQRGFDDFAARWLPILAEFKRADVRFALEVHPTEIAFDIATAARSLAAVQDHPCFGFNYDPSHLGYQGVDYIRFIREFGPRIFHAHMKDVWWGRGDGAVGVFGGHTSFGDSRRYWDFRSPGRGEIRFEEIIVALNDCDYRGPLSVEWEDARMDREHGAREACAFVRKLDFPQAKQAFDGQFK